MFSRPKGRREISKAIRPDVRKTRLDLRENDLKTKNPESNLEGHKTWYEYNTFDLTRKWSHDQKAEETYLEGHETWYA